MKVRVIQPAYTFNADDLQKNYDGMVALMEKCDEPLDVIVLPEYCDIPSAQVGKEGYRNAIAKYNAPVMKKAIEMAKRCHSIVFINCAYEYEKGKFRNTTHAIDREGNIVGRYYKAHPAPKEDKGEEVGGIGMDSSYSIPGSKPYVIEIEGIRFGFMTCMDFYMYEEFPQLAREKVDVVIGCSLQRTDTHQALEIINRFLVYNVNAYLVRSSVSLGEDSPIGGCSCVMAPNGDVLVDMKSRVGYETVEIDPKKKYCKSSGFGGKNKPPQAHYEYIEAGRRPWLYRNGGASVVRTDDDMPYPRLCAHRGFNTVAPENSMPAFGAAVALGAEEIEFDLRTTKDGVLVSIHDYLLDRVSDGVGNIECYTYEELLKFDFGVKYGEKFKGLRIIKFEEILQKFAGRVIMNIHVKLWENPKFDWKIKEIADLIHQYDCEKQVYFVGVADGIRAMKEYAPQLKCCMSAAPDPWKIVDRAIDCGAEKVQLYKPYFNREMIEKAHANGIKCNVFWSDDVDEAERFIQMGVDCILTNDYLKIKTALEEKGLL